MTTKHAYAASAKLQGADPESSRAAGSGPHHVTLALDQKCLCLDTAVLSFYLVFILLKLSSFLFVPLLLLQFSKTVGPELLKLCLGFAFLVLSSSSSCSPSPPFAICLFRGFSCYYYFLSTK